MTALNLKIFILIFIIQNHGHGFIRILLDMVVDVHFCHIYSEL